MLRAARRLSRDTSPAREARDAAVGKRFRAFGAVFGFEIVIIALGIVLLNVFHHPEFRLPFVTIVVGFHFLPLARLFTVRLYSVIGVLLVLVGMIVVLAVPVAIYDTGAQPIRLRSKSFGALVLTFFGTFWAVYVAVGLNFDAGWLPLIVDSLIATLLFVTSFRLMRAERRKYPTDATSEEGKRSQNYLLVTVLQGAAMLVAIVVLRPMHHQEYILPCIAFIVGLHFFALVNILQRRLYYFVGTAICPLAFLTVLSLPTTAQFRGIQIFPWVVVIGSGCALILWSTAAETLLQIRENLRQEELTQRAHI